MGVVECRSRTERKTSSPTCTGSTVGFTTTTSWVTAAVFDLMAKAGVRGPNFEIGVYAGKYLSVIHHCSGTYHEPTLTVGLDAYLFGKSEQDAADTWTRMFGSTLGLKIVRGDSLITKPAEVIQ